MRRLIAPLAALLVALTFALPTGGTSMAHAATTQTVTNVPLPQGTTTFPAATAGWSLPTPSTLLSSIDATTCPATATITMAVERSTDGGLPGSWGDWVFYTLNGGPHMNKLGGSTWDNSTDWAGGNLRLRITTDQACTIKSASVTVG